jgi:ABC-2 type transport system ATP-binding protein
MRTEQAVDMGPMIDASNLEKSFGPTRAVAGVSLAVRGGEIYGLVGSDGAGKTTTMRLLVGALEPDAGRCSVAGHDLTTDAERARAEIGYLSQRFSLYEDLPRCLEVLNFVGLAEFKDRRAGRLSGGMRQKLGLASALVGQPRVLLLDEPTTGVDPVTRQDFWQLLVALVSSAGAREAASQAADSPNRSGSQVAVLLSTPYMDEAARCSRVGFMRQGRIIVEDTPSRLRARLNGRILELRGSPLAVLRRISEADEGVEAVRAFGDRLHLRVVQAQGPAVIERVTHGVQAEGGTVEELRQIPPTLEDVFIQLSEPTHA